MKQNDSELWKVLQLPEYINGLPKRLRPELLIKNNELYNLQKTTELFQDIYYMMSYARFSLIMADTKDHSKIIPHGDGQDWYRTLNCNNAILWYNSCFDLLLQTIWIYKKLYIGYNFEKRNGKPEKYYKDLEYEYFLILKGCNFSSFSSQYKTNKKIVKCIRKFNTESEIRKLANQIKHNKLIRYSSLYTQPVFGFAKKNEIGYSITKNEPLEDMDEIIKILCIHHKKISILIYHIFKHLELNIIPPL